MITQDAFDVAEFVRSKTLGIRELDWIHPIFGFTTLTSHVYVTRLHQIRLVKSYAITADAKNRGHERTDLAGCQLGATVCGVASGVPPACAGGLLWDERTVD
jgi:hypothetical protein